MKLFKQKLFAYTSSLAIVLAMLLPTTVAAQGESKDFNLQVTPSPLVVTVKPGETKTVDITIRNLGTHTETLRMGLRSFNFNSDTGKVKLNDTVPAQVSSWVTFSSQEHTVQPGQITTDHVTFRLPEQTGFSYSFAILISRKNDPIASKGTQQLTGAIAVFTLINVDRPGATRKLEVTNFKTSQWLYEHVPVKLDVRFKNSGNTIAQPLGNVFIQRKSDSAKPISVLKVNAASSYILPGTTRSTDVEWNEGFPNLQPVDNERPDAPRATRWDLKTLDQFRVGKYTAKLVAIYNDGQRDVPIESEVSFWVFPWKAAILLLLVIVGLFFLGRWRAKQRTDKAVKRALAKAKQSDE